MGRQELGKLRDIAWAIWDPIGMSHIEGRWQDSAAADEYDGYMRSAEALVIDGKPDEAVKLLVQTERWTIGLGDRDDTLERARKTVDAIQALVAAER